MHKTEAAKEILKLNTAELHKLAAELASYALKRWLPLKYEIYLNEGQSLAGYHAEDFACEALNRALSTRKQWDKKKYPTLRDFLYSIVRSIINHFLNSSGYRQATLEDGADPNSDDNNDSESIRYVEQQQSHNDSPIDSAQKEERKELLGIEFYCSLNDDQEAQNVLALMLQDKKPSKIAKELQTDASRVYAAKKRILGRLDLFWKEIGEKPQANKKKVANK